MKGRASTAGQVRYGDGKVRYTGGFHVDDLLVNEISTGERFLAVDSTLGSVLQALAVVVAAWLVALPLEQDMARYRQLGRGASLQWLDLTAEQARSLADSLQLPVTPFVVCTALGAVVAFLTPIGHHGNLLILGPGNYRFHDFLRIGLPLTVMIALVSAWMAQWLWLGGALLPF